MLVSHALINAATSRRRLVAAAHDRFITHTSVSTMRLSSVTPGPIWMAHEWPMSAGVRVWCHIASRARVEPTYKPLSTSHTTLGLTLLHEARMKV
jgi:hypothetical protein